MGGAESAAYRNIKWCENTARQEQRLSVAGPQGRCFKRAGLRHRLDRRNRNAHRAAKKNQRRSSSGKNKRPTPKTKARRRKIDAPHPLPCARSKDGGTTSGRSSGRRSGCILKQRPLSTAAIKACGARTPTRRCPKSARRKESVVRDRQEKKPRHLQPTRPLRQRHRHLAAGFSIKLRLLEP